MNICSEASSRKSTSELSPEDEGFLHQFILQRTGILIQHHQQSKLRSKLQELCLTLGYSSSCDLLKSLYSSDNKSPELESLIASITIGESYFFRDGQQFDWLQYEYFPDIIHRRRRSGNLSLRVWSAGSSAGQEIYSIAILLRELLPDIDDWDLHLFGTDINAPALTSAQRGQYREWSLRGMSDRLRAKYFCPVNELFELRHDVRQQVKFHYLNLAEDVFPSILSKTNALDLILCRNVFIYLAPETSQEIVCKFANCLKPDGQLLLGAVDTVRWKDTGLNQIRSGDVLFYRKNKQALSTDSRIQLIDFQLDSCYQPDVDGEGDRESHIESDGQNQDSVSALPQDTQNCVPQKNNLRLAEKTFSTAPARIEDNLIIANNITILNLYQKGRWQELVSAVDTFQAGKDQNASLLGYKARALANLGQLEQSERVCRESIGLNPNDKHIYLVQGLVRMEKGQLEKAEASFRKALYLDRYYPESHYRLGLLLITNGQSKKGIKSLEQALLLAERGDQRKCLEYTQGITYQHFARMLRQELSIFGNTGI
ncbi:CheR family methyltransferase [Motiliproteus sp. MSK22-1]|uniref:CheR family methyltransferase n=1 Tax=Motiliproteus sp. MSK22-1 TaxID=1897630 RepID=UPI0009787E06|nr:CheR family methyltransferase [Motiliproteus sp. MSK22-1]OMH32675.1 hypothetical protein BGP75_14120 [Motiliproteus sp. MSK22-1]